MIPISQPRLDWREKAAISDVIDSGQLAQGERVEEFERWFAAYVGATHAVAVANGTAALHLTLSALGISSSQHEVITVPFTFFATASAIVLAGGTPVFVDVTEDDFCIDVDQVEAAITPRTRAVLPVSLYGQPPRRMEELSLLCSNRGIALLEDASQAHGASLHGRRSGTWGSGGTFSFYATKNMTTGEGGMLTTIDAVLAERVRRLRQHGSRGGDDHEQIGYNLRMTEIQAAIGIVQLEKLPAFNERRRAIAARYGDELLAMTPQPANGHVYHQYVLRVQRRDEFAERLRQLGVQTRVHYPVPLHRQLPFDSGQTFPVTEQLTKEILSIPVHPGLSDDQVSDVIASVNQVWKSLR